MNTETILSIVLTATVSALSLTVSILTIIFNNRHQRKMKILDIVYEKKYSTYQEFFKLYAEFVLTEKYDTTILTNVIMNCLLVSNQNTTKHLKSLLNKVKMEYPKELSYLDLTKNTFKNCINSMKEELHLS